jgi:hypothetical protein
MIFNFNAPKTPTTIKNFLFNKKIIPQNEETLKLTSINQ